MALTTVAKVKAWANPSMDSARDTEITRIITAVGAWLPRVTGRVIEATAFTRYLNGCDAGGRNHDKLHLPTGHRPVVHSGGTLVTCSEDGVALTLALGYSTTAGVVIENANVDLPCTLVRNLGSWSSWSPQNITVVYTAGYSTIGLEVEQLANELAYREFIQPGFLARASASRSEHSVSWDDKLTAESRALLASLTVL